MTKKEQEPIVRIQTEEVDSGTGEYVHRWKASTHDGAVARTLRERYDGGEVRRTPIEEFSVVLGRDDLLVLIPSGDSPRLKFESPPSSSERHVCDGQMLLGPEAKKGICCGCPEDWARREARARRNEGPHPQIGLRFMLRGAEEIGICSFSSSSWALARSLASLESTFRRSQGVVSLNLHLNHRHFVSRSGVEVTIVRPELSLVLTA